MVHVKGVVYKYNSFDKNVTTLEGVFYIKYIFGRLKCVMVDYCLELKFPELCSYFEGGFICFGCFARIERGKNVSCFADRFRLWCSHCGNLWYLLVLSTLNIHLLNVYLHLQKDLKDAAPTNHQYYLFSVYSILLVFLFFAFSLSCHVLRKCGRKICIT